MLLSRETVKPSKKLSEFKKFAVSLKNSDKIAIIYDSDSDGLSSAVIVSKAVDRLVGKNPEHAFFQSHSIVALLDETIDKLEKNAVNKLIVLDLAVDQDAVQVKKAEKF